MSDSSRRKYIPKLVLLAPEDVTAIHDEAVRRIPDYDTRPKTETRIENPIVRDVFQFWREHYTLFLDWIAARGNVA